MKGSELTHIVRSLGTLIQDGQRRLSPRVMNEEWTKNHLIVPLLDALGWDSPYERLPEDSPNDIEDSIDYLLKAESPGACSLCVEAKSLLSPPPQDRSHEWIKKGLEQTKARNADYFIWTNGDTWQLLVARLPNAPIYEMAISQVCGDEGGTCGLLDGLRLLSRETSVANPEAIVEGVRAYWRQIALPKAFVALSTELANETVELMRRVLPDELNISSMEVLQFLRECHWKGADIRRQSPMPRRTRQFTPCPEEWERLVTSVEPRYEKARAQLIAQPRRKLGEYLISDSYEPWRATVTFSLLGLARRGSDTKTVTGPAVERYKLYGFIQIVDPQARSDDMTYRRIDEAMPYLRRILNSQ